MKKSKIIIISIALLVLISGCSQEPQQNKTEKKDYSVDIPREWTGVSISGNKVFRISENSYIKLAVEDRKDSLEKLLESATSEYGDFGDLNQTGKGDTTLSGQQAKYNIIEFIITGSTKLNVKTIVAVKGEKSYIIKYVAPEGEFNQYSAQVDSVTSSFKIE